ncbi:glutathione synthase [Cellulomonas sp. JZ18]|uniref:ATP-grasp domain-containing protein n=1 Tax=Cellulomonas sp. JZ18 TaxID=2654191 RepID=UPI0012D41F05|nr:glutathione synthase [Cellulomonas sp. JZ18]QGQ19433.1 glutathione synthase [Cellulomonas sp. JZ18]
MILLAGIPSETPLSLVVDELDRVGAAYTTFHQRHVAGASVDLRVEEGRVRGRLELGGVSHPLESFTAAYLRLMDDRMLPELADEPEGSPARTHARAVHEVLVRWSDVAPCRVVNRYSAMASNGSKPYQVQLIRRHGLDVPETLVTNVPQLVREFRRRHGRIVYKSMSGVRSVVRVFDDEDDARLDRIRWCPTQFQAFVPGEDVRVHVVGTRVLATAIRSDGVDYRYAGRDGHDGSEAQLRPVELEPALARRCVDLARALGLPFAGIDLKVTPDGDVVCFEVNPSPAYSYYELSTGQPIAAELVRYLRGLQEA